MCFFAWRLWWRFFAYVVFVLYLSQDTLKFFAFFVWFYIFMIFHQDTCCKLNIESIIDSSAYVLFSFVKLSEFDILILTLTLRIIRVLYQVLIIIRLIEICGQNGAFLFQNLYELAGNHAVRRSSILDNLFHNFHRQIFQSGRQFALCLGLAMHFHTCCFLGVDGLKRFRIGHSLINREIWILLNNFDLFLRLDHLLRFWFLLFCLYFWDGFESTEFIVLDQVR